MTGNTKGYYGTESMLNNEKPPKKLASKIACIKTSKNVINRPERMFQGGHFYFLLACFLLFYHVRIKTYVYCLIVSDKKKKKMHSASHT